MIFEILFWLSFSCLFHSYILFPLILSLLAKGKILNTQIYNPNDSDLPGVSILLAVFNEESVIDEKIKSTFKTIYPFQKIEFIIGSDACSDKTNQIIKQNLESFPNIKLIEFENRTGKAAIINYLQTIAKNEVLILTDANVFFEPVTIYNLVKHYKNQEIALVGGNIINKNFKNDGISFQEKSYLLRENKIKYQEGIIWGKMIGSFGGCYSILKKYYSPVPRNYLMDDFYITFGVFERNKKAICELDAICYEDVSNKIQEEFRRKVRISIGNFQNLNRFKKLLFFPLNGLSFSFFSHKILRWFGPVFIALAFLCSAILWNHNNMYRLFFISQTVLLLFPLFDFLLKKMNINIGSFRFITHFYIMNIALFVGLIKYLNGVNTNVWRPTERNQ